MRKHSLTVRQAKNIIKELQNELDLYLTKKKINFERTQPKASKMKDAIISKTGEIFDSFTTYMIKDEECDDKIYALQESILAYETYLSKELNRMREYDEISLIVFLKEELNWTWKEIDETLHNSCDYSRTKYNRYKKSKIDTI